MTTEKQWKDAYSFLALRSLSGELHDLQRKFSSLEESVKYAEEFFSGKTQINPEVARFACIGKEELYCDNAIILGSIKYEYNKTLRELRHRYAALYNSYYTDPMEFRRMIIGWHINRDGLALDPNTGKVIESYQGSFYDKGHKLFPIAESERKMNVYLDDSCEAILDTIGLDNYPAVIEYLANFDMKKRDKINHLYFRLAKEHPEHPISRFKEAILKAPNEYF